MRPLAASLALGACLAASPVGAQPLVIDASHRAGPVPAEPGAGVPVRWVHGFFAGFPFHIDDARDLLDETAVIPAFETWCGSMPYINVGNRSTWDSLGRGAPTQLCAPFLDRAETSEFTCRALPGVPFGRYWRNGGAAMRAIGALAVRSAGVYTFAWGHDDGVSFRFGPTRVYEYPDGTAPRVDLASVRFDEPGLYPFTLEWFDGIGGALLDWYIAEGERRAGEFSNFAFTLVPPTDLYAIDGRACTSDCRSCEAPTPLCDRAAGRCVACTARAGCARCERCADGRCVIDRTLPGCERDAGLVSGEDVLAPAVDVPAPDAVAASREVAPGPGCACGAVRGDSRPWAFTLLALLGVGCRRRRR